MSNLPSPDEPQPDERSDELARRSRLSGAEELDGQTEPAAAVFARINEVRLDRVDEFIGMTQQVYEDLNSVCGHPYWADLVYQQGAALKALREAREALVALGAEAVGARNTELGITVTTAVIAGERSYAHREDDKFSVVEQLLRPAAPASARHLYVWDRPYDNDEIAGPYQNLRIITADDAELGVLHYTEESEDGELRSWHTCNGEPIADAPRLCFDSGSALIFPRESILPFADLRAALLEFTRTGTKPTCVRWQQARWGE